MICIQEDEFTQWYAEGHTRWIVSLDNGQTVFQDDGRPGLENSAWLRLKEYCENNNLYITNMSIGFRSNRYNLEPNADGYYFAKGVRGMWGAPKTIQLIFVGILIDEELRVSCWKSPEMILEKTELRNIDESTQCLIRKNINH